VEATNEMLLSDGGKTLGLCDIHFLLQEPV
jgi:hypothetical protein